MTDNMNFDRFFYEFLKNKLTENNISIYKKDEGINIILDDSSDVNKWIRDDNFIITVRSKSKSDVSNHGTLISNAIKDLYSKDGILSVFIERERHDLEGIPQFWVSQLYVRVRRRSFSIWHL